MVAIEDLNGQMIDLVDIVGGQTTVIALLRHFG
jgi:hypothetical protein